MPCKPPKPSKPFNYRNYERLDGFEAIKALHACKDCSASRSAMPRRNPNLTALATPDSFQKAALNLRLSVGRSREWPVVVGADDTIGGDLLGAGVSSGRHSCFCCPVIALVSMSFVLATS
jgi:hypothetical protein